MTGIAILIRHGESEGNKINVVSHDHKGFPLTENGRKQAKAVGEALSEIMPFVDQIVCSPLERALQTGEILAKAGGFRKHISINDEIHETYFGNLNNTSSKNVPKFHKPGGEIESFESQAQRMHDAIFSYAGINIFVSHMLPIKALVCTMLGVEEEDAGGLFMKNCSITIIDTAKNTVLSMGAQTISSKVANVISGFSKGK